MKVLYYILLLLLLLVWSTFAAPKLDDDCEDDDDRVFCNTNEIDDEGDSSVDQVRDQEDQEEEDDNDDDDDHYNYRDVEESKTVPFQHPQELKSLRRPMQAQFVQYMMRQLKDRNDRDRAALMSFYHARQRSNQQPTQIPLKHMTINRLNQEQLQPVHYKTQQRSVFSHKNPKKLESFYRPGQHNNRFVQDRKQETQIVPVQVPLKPLQTRQPARQHHTQSTLYKTQQPRTEVYQTSEKRKPLQFSTQSAQFRTQQPVSIPSSFLAEYNSMPYYRPVQHKMQLPQYRTRILTQSRRPTQYQTAFARKPNKFRRVQPQTTSDYWSSKESNLNRNSGKVQMKEWNTDIHLFPEYRTLSTLPINPSRLAERRTITKETTGSAENINLFNGFRSSSKYNRDVPLFILG